MPSCLVPFARNYGNLTYLLAQMRRNISKNWRRNSYLYRGLVLRRTSGKPRYYACRGRVFRKNWTDGKRCKLPYVRADWFECKVWEKVKEVLSNSEKLNEYVNRSLAELEERKKEISARSTDIDSKIEAVRAKEERLGMAFADGAINEEAYKSKLKRLKKEEAGLLGYHHSIDIDELAETISLGIHIDMIKEVLSKGSLLVTDFGIIGEIGDTSIHIGDTETLQIDGDELVIKDKSTLLESKDGESPQEKQEAIERNKRAILQFFNIKVIVYPERVEVKGSIPTQMLDKMGKEDKTAPIITSALPKEGEEIKRGASAPLGWLFPFGVNGLFNNWFIFPNSISKRRNAC
jgi:hypothetical protein